MVILSQPQCDDSATIEDNNTLVPEAGMAK